MESMTFAEAAEHVLREAGKAMSVKDLWAAIVENGLVETEGETPEATLQVELARRSANSSVTSKVDGPPRFYQRGDDVYGLWAHLSPEQQRAVIAAAREVPRSTVDAMAKLTSERQDPEFARRVFESMIDDADSRLAIASFFAKLIQDAHAIYPGCWKVTVRPKDWRLVVGPVRIAKLSRRRLALLTISDLEELAPEAKALLGEVAWVHPKQPPRVVEGGVHRILHPEQGQHRMNAVYTTVRPIATASARRVRQVPNPRTHSPGAIEYLSKLLGLQLPQPVYTSRDDGREVDGNEDDDDLSPPVSEGTKTIGATGAGPRPPPVTRDPPTMVEVARSSAPSRASSLRSSPAATLDLACGPWEEPVRGGSLGTGDPGGNGSLGDRWRQRLG